MSRLSLYTQRSRAKNLINTFLQNKGYTEVETPILATRAIPESTIELYETHMRVDRKDKEKFYLLPSPELYMKRILAESKTSIYQFSRCFRNNEQYSKIHSPEFTMLEYYAVNEDELYSLKVTEELFQMLALEFDNKELNKKFNIISMRDAVKNITGLDLNKLQDKKDLQDAIETKGITVYDRSESWADSFNRLFVALVEPELPDKEAPLVVTDYPIQIDCLAENTKDGRYKRRWELYYKGIELANCYKEETSRERTDEYFKKEDSLVKERDGEFKSDFDMINLRLPHSSGVALGFDRLMMCILKKKEIKDIIPFSYKED